MPFGGATYARLRFGGDPGGNFVLPVQIDFQASFPAADHSAWEAEYLECVSVEVDSRRSCVADFNDIGPSLWPDQRRKNSAFGLIAFASELALDPFLEHCDG